MRSSLQQNGVGPGATLDHPGSTPAQPWAAEPGTPSAVSSQRSRSFHPSGGLVSPLRWGLTTVLLQHRRAVRAAQAGCYRQQRAALRPCGVQPRSKAGSEATSEY